MRVRIFDILDDERIVFRAEGDLQGVIPPQLASDYATAVEGLYLIGHCIYRPIAEAPLVPQVRPVLLIRAGLGDRRDADLEESALRRRVAQRAATLIWRRHDDGDSSSIDAVELLVALAQAADHGCALRLRDLAAAGDAELLHDVIGIWRHRDPVSGMVDAGTFRPRFAAIAEPGAPAPVASPGSDHHARVCLEALAADAPLPWRMEDSGTANIVLLDAEHAYVCDIAPDDFAAMDGSNDGRQIAHQVARTILLAVNGRLPEPEAADA